MAGEIKKNNAYLSFIGMCFLLTGFIMGCSGPVKENTPNFLIKTSSMSIGLPEFLEELDLKKAAYPYNIRDNPEEYNEMVMDLVKMLSEEIVLLSAAADKGVIITDTELAAAEKEFKKDYPEDSFDHILLENAISYSFWLKRFKKNMIIEKLIDQELKKNIIITSEDIVDFYKKHRMTDIKTPGKNSKSLTRTQKEKELVSRLRNQKTQDHYSKWIQVLKKDYPVEINYEKLKNILINVIEKKEIKNEKKD